MSSDDGIDRAKFVSIERRKEETGLTVVDRIDRHRFPIATDQSAEFEPATPEEFLFPVDAGIETAVESFSLSNVVVICVRTEDGMLLTENDYFDHETFPRRSYSLEIHGPIKMFIEAEAALELHTEDGRTSIQFENESTARVGARSYHKRPAETVKTTNNIEDLMSAVSTFGSALKTLSPERSFPTLRGHPPTIDLGDEFHVPESLEPPETGIRIEVPNDIGLLYAVAPLAFYLGANVVPGESTRIVTDDGYEYPLGEDCLIKEDIARTLKQVFFLDCVTRTEGLYRIDLDERNAVEPTLDLNFEVLYETPIAERTERYLRVPYEKIADHVPTWNQTAHVDPTPEHVETLPFLVANLAEIRSGETEPIDPSAVAVAESQLPAIEDFTRGTRGSDPSLVRPPATDSVENVWVGNGIPISGNKTIKNAFYNGLQRDPTEDEIEITVVYNDEQMRAERPEEEYGTNKQLPFDVNIRHDLCCTEFKDALGDCTDFLHYVGHVDEEGFECSDGRLDATTLDEVGVDAFFLNACRSYDQGVGLIEAGASGGIVTMDTVINSRAVEMGKTIAKLLAAGFSLGASLEVVGKVTPSDIQYVVVGDNRLALSEFPGGTPHICNLEVSDSSIDLSIRTYTPTATGFGSLFIPYIPDYDRYHLVSGDVGTFRVSRDDLRHFLSQDNAPVFLDGDLHWSDDLDVSEL